MLFTTSEVGGSRSGTQPITGLGLDPVHYPKALGGRPPFGSRVWKLSTSSGKLGECREVRAVSECARVCVPPHWMATVSVILCVAPIGRKAPAGCVDLELQSRRVTSPVFVVGVWTH